MHTSSLLTSSDFAYWRLEAGVATPTDFAALFPDYHELDRVGVISPRLEDGVCFTGASLLALTTSFYDIQRAKGETFFNYPQHFALIGGAGDTVWTHQGLVPKTEPLLGYTWGNLDVWPDTNWFVAPPTAAGMLQQVFALQINRLFLPENLPLEGSGPRLPAYGRSLLCSRLKSVFLYGATSPNTRIQALARANDVLTKSATRLPGDAPRPSPDAVDSFRQITPQAFLTAMAGCFDEEETNP